MARSPSKETAEATPKTDKLAEARGRNLDLAIQQIQKDYGEGAILRMGGEGIKSDISVIPTGNLLIDQALGGTGAFQNCQLTRHIGLPDDVTLTDLTVTLASGALKVHAAVSKSGTCYDATGTVDASIAISVILCSN